MPKGKLYGKGFLAKNYYNYNAQFVSDVPDSGEDIFKQIPVY